MKHSFVHTLPSSIDPAWRIGIIRSSYYPEEVDMLVQGAKVVLEEAGVAVWEFHAPGSFEIPLIGVALAKAKAVDALLGFGIIIEGETHHAELLAREVARGIMDVQIIYGLPFAFEVLYVRTLEQVLDRMEGPKSKGAEAAYAVLHSLAELHRISR